MKRCVILVMIDRFSFIDCSRLTEVVIGKSLKVIGVEMFARCTDLTSITIPTGVKKIDSSAFMDSSLKTITFGAGIDMIAIDAFKRNPIETINVPAKKTDYYKSRLPQELHDKIVELPPEMKAKK